jgi:hypothetical protein
LFDVAESFHKGKWSGAIRAIILSAAMNRKLSAEIVTIKRTAG